MMDLDDTAPDMVSNLGEINKICVDTGKEVFAFVIHRSERNREAH